MQINLIVVYAFTRPFLLHHKERRQRQVQRVCVVSCCCFSIHKEVVCTCINSNNNHSRSLNDLWHIRLMFHGYFVKTPKKEIIKCNENEHKNKKNKVKQNYAPRAFESDTYKRVCIFAIIKTTFASSLFFFFCSLQFC